MSKNHVPVTSNSQFFKSLWQIQGDSSYDHKILKRKIIIRLLKVKRGLHLMQPTEKLFEK